MSRLYCSKCAREVPAQNMFVCYNCGAFICKDCAEKQSNLCPDCFEGLSRIH